MIKVLRTLFFNLNGCDTTKPNGGECEDDSECLEGSTCSTRVCSGLEFPDGNNKCETGKKICLGGKTGDGSKCENMDQCQDGLICLDQDRGGNCVDKLENDTKCAYNLDCKSGYCELRGGTGDPSYPFVKTSSSGNIGLCKSDKDWDKSKGTGTGTGTK